MNESEFTKLLTRYEKGLCTPSERELIEKWLDSPNFKRQNPFKDETERIMVKDALRQAVYNGTGISAKRGMQIHGSRILQSAGLPKGFVSKSIVVALQLAIQSGGNLLTAIVDVIGVTP